MSQFDGFLPWRRFLDKDDDSTGGSFNNNGKDIGMFDDAIGLGGHLCLRPYLYHVVLVDRKETSVDMLEQMIKQFLKKTETESERLAKNIHSTGKAICATYTREIAEMKIEEINKFSQEHNLVVQCMMEKGNKHAF